MSKITEAQAILIAAIIGLVGVLIGGYFIMEAAQKPFRLSVQTTQTAEAKLTEVAERLPTSTPLPTLIAITPTETPVPPTNTPVLEPTDTPITEPTQTFTPKPSPTSRQLRLHTSYLKS